MNPGLLSRLFAAKQEPQRLEQAPGDIWAGSEIPRPAAPPGPEELMQGRDPYAAFRQLGAPQHSPDDLMPMRDDPYAALAQLGGGRDPEGLMTPQFMYDRPSIDTSLDSPEGTTPDGDADADDSYGPPHVMEQLPVGLESRTSLGQGYEGMQEPGNIDLTDRPNVENPDGSHSSVRSMSFGSDDGEVLVPTVNDGGWLMNDAESMDQYNQTGRHLGTFDNTDNADTYAEALHQQQAGTPQGPLIQGAPLSQMFGPPAPRSLPRMTSR